MIDYSIYGKIIIDSIRLLDETIVHRRLGGGGPQAAFGARVWSPSVALASRIGSGFDHDLADQLAGLDVNTESVLTIPEVDTLRGFMSYDDDDYLVTRDQRTRARLDKLFADLAVMLRYDVELSRNGSLPKVCHLITEYFSEDAVQQALRMKEHGTILSLEPIIDHRAWSNRDELIDFLPHVDVVSPDWPSAAGLAESDDPKEVLRWWSLRGPECVAIRNGRHGSYVWDRRHDAMWHVPIIDVQRVDPTGCGNSYGGGVCVGWERHADAKVAGAMGTVSATFMVEAAGLPRTTEDTKRRAEEYLDRLTDSIRAM